MNKILPSLEDASSLTFEEALKYAEALPGGDLPRSKEALKDYERIYKDENGENLPEVVVIKRLMEMRARIAAKVEQVAAIKDKLKRDGLNRSAKLAEERTWDRKVLETGFLPKAEFGKERRTVGKLTQEILSTDYELVGGLGNYEADKAVIDPMKITDTLLVNLGLEQFVPEKKAGELDKLARRAEATSEIKEMLGNLEPLKLSARAGSGRNFLRLFTITEGEYAGYVLGTQVNHGKKLLFRTDLHGAARRLELIDQGYGEEMRELVGINHQVILAKGLLSDGKNKKAIQEAFHNYQEMQKKGEAGVMKKPEMMKKYERIIAELLENLGDVINGEKLKIQNQLKQSADLIEKRVRPARVKMVKGQRVETPAQEYETINIESKLARLSAIHDSISKRLKEIRAIQAYLLADEQILKDKINNMEAPFVDFIKTVEGMHEQFKIYREKGMTQQESSTVARNLEVLIVRPMEKSFPEGKVELEPYASFKNKMLEQTVKTADLLKNQIAGKGGNEAAKEFTKIYLIAKIVGLHKDLQRFYAGNLSGEDREMGEKALKEIEEIKAKFGKRGVAPQVEVKDFAEQYDEFYHLVNSLKKRTIEINQKSQEIEDLKRQLGEMKEADALELQDIKKKLAGLEKEKRRLKNAAKERFRNFDFAKMIRDLEINSGGSEEAGKPDELEGE